MIEKSTFFITGMGRSGSVFLANLLDFDPNVAVFHEYPPIDRKALILALTGEDPFLSDERVELVEKRIKDSGVEIYGEVNSYLRHHVDMLTYHFEEPTILHLVRDGRNVVRSMMDRKAYTARDVHHSGQITPDESDKFYDQWLSFTRFQKVCWCWNHTIQYLQKRYIKFINLEKILSDYDYFAEHVLSPTGVVISSSTWEYEVSHPRNQTEVPTFPVWDDWDDELREQFDEICGDSMEDLGYWS